MMRFFVNSERWGGGSWSIQSEKKKSVQSSLLLSVRLAFDSILPSTQHPSNHHEMRSFLSFGWGVAC